MPSPLSLFCVVLPIATTAFQPPALHEATRSHHWISHVALESSRGGLSWEERSTKRRASVQKMEAIKQRFASGKELEDLRSDLENLRENLGWAEAMRDEDRMRDLNEAIEAGEQRDPEAAYETALDRMEEAKKGNGLDVDAQVERWSIEAAAARSCIARFSLEGLWIGNYGEPGFEMINVTYSGDTLIANKVTGDQNVPRGEVSFTADLGKRDKSDNEELPPIELSGEAAEKWGINKLARYPGKGVVAKTGFVDAKDVEGQLIMFECHFSFVWLPTKHHVFFGRPSPEVSIRMLRDIISEEDEVENMRAHAQRCIDMDMTTSLARQHVNGQIEPFRRIKREDELKKLEETMKAQEEADKSKRTAFSGYFDFRKWKSTLDDALGK